MVRGAAGVWFVGTIQGHLITPPHATQHPKHDVGDPSGLEYMGEALQESHMSTCGDATPLGSIGAVDIAIVMPNTTYSHAEGSL
jgi:hypothetical protein